jgi:hypothetical protein
LTSYVGPTNNPLCVFGEIEKLPVPDQFRFDVIKSAALGNVKRANVLADLAR